MHIPRFGSLLVDILICKACCRGVIGLDRSSWLWMIKFLKNVSDWNSNLGIMKYTRGFCASRRGYYIFESFVLDQDCSIDGWMRCLRRMIGEVIVTSNSAFGLGHDKICCIRVNYQYHVTSVEPNKDLWMSH